MHTVTVNLLPVLERVAAEGGRAENMEEHLFLSAYSTQYQT